MTHLSPTQNNRQILALLRQEDTFSINNTGFEFLDVPLSTVASSQGIVQVKSSGNVDIGAAQVVHEKPYSTDLFTIRSQPEPATAISLSMVGTAVRGSERTFTGMALPPSFALDPSALSGTDRPPSSEGHGSASAPEDTPSSMDERPVVSDSSTQHNLDGGSGGDVAILDSFALNTSHPSSTNGPSPDYTATELDLASRSLNGVVELAAVTKETIDREVFDAASQRKNGKRRNDSSDTPTQTPPIEASVHDHRFPGLASHWVRSSEPVGYLDLTNIVDDTPAIHFEDQMSAARRDALHANQDRPSMEDAAIPSSHHNITNSHGSGDSESATTSVVAGVVADHPEPEPSKELIDTLNRLSPEVIELTPAATNPAVETSAVEVHPPLPSDNPYFTEIADEKINSYGTAKKYGKRVAVEVEENQQDSMRSTIKLQRPRTRKRTPKKGKFSGGSSAANNDSDPDFVSSQTIGTNVERMPRTRASTTPSQIPSPSYSAQSIRSGSTQSMMEGTGHRIFFASSTTIHTLSPIKRFLREHKITSVRSLDKCTHLCVGLKEGELKKTSNLVKAVMSGKNVVTSKWLSDSNKQKKVLDPVDYVPCAPKEWDVDLEKAIQRARREGVWVLSGYLVNFTQDAKDALGDGFEDVKKIALAAGASKAQYVKSDKIQATAKKSQEEKTIWIAEDEEDVDLNRCRSEGLTAYTRDVVLMSVLRGRLDLDSKEFIVSRKGRDDDLALSETGAPASDLDSTPSPTSPLAAVAPTKGKTDRKRKRQA